MPPVISDSISARSATAAALTAAPAAFALMPGATPIT
jgi:hypothetical protein